MIWVSVHFFSFPFLSISISQSSILLILLSTETIYRSLIMNFYFWALYFSTPEFPLISLIFFINSLYLVRLSLYLSLILCYKIVMVLPQKLTMENGIIWYIPVSAITQNCCHLNEVTAVGTSSWPHQSLLDLFFHKTNYRGWVGCWGS